VELKRMSKLSFEARDGIAILKLDNPPVNSLGHELREALVAALERANADPGIKAPGADRFGGRLFPAAPTSVNSAHPRRWPIPTCAPSSASSKAASSR